MLFFLSSITDIKKSKQQSNNQILIKTHLRLQAHDLVHKTHVAPKSTSSVALGQL